MGFICVLCQRGPSHLLECAPSHTDRSCGVVGRCPDRMPAPRAWFALCASYNVPGAILLPRQRQLQAQVYPSEQPDGCLDMLEVRPVSVCIAVEQCPAVAETAPFVEEVHDHVAVIGGWVARAIPSPALVIGLNLVIFRRALDAQHLCPRLNRMPACGEDAIALIIVEHHAEVSYAARPVCFIWRGRQRGQVLGELQ